MDEHSILGLRQSWLEIQCPNGNSYEVTAGAGLGSPLLAVEIERDGTRETWTMSVVDR